MKQILIIIYLFTINIIGTSQKSIEIPIVEFSETKEDFKNFVTIYLFSDGTIRLNEKEINSDKQLRLELISIVSYQMMKKRMDYSLMTIELNVDKNCPANRVVETLEKLQDYSFEKVFITANNEFFSRINGIWSIGFNLVLPKKTEMLFNIRKHVQDSLNIPPPPPPPPIYWKKTWKYLPVTNYNVNTIDENKDILQIVELVIENDSTLAVNGHKIEGISKIEERINEILERELAVFRIQFEENLSYESIVRIISMIKEPLYTKRNETSNKIYEMNYDELGYYEKANVADLHPDIILLKE